MVASATTSQLRAAPKTALKQNDPLLVDDGEADRRLSGGAAYPAAGVRRRGSFEHLRNQGI